MAEYDVKARCGSCKADLIWAMTENGRRTPVDAEPVSEGTILLRHLEAGKTPIAHVTTDEERQQLAAQSEARGETLKLFVSHFATCPDHEKYRGQGT